MDLKTYPLAPLAHDSVIKCIYIFKKTIIIMVKSGNLLLRYPRHTAVVIILLLFAASFVIVQNPIYSPGGRYYYSPTPTPTPTYSPSPSPTASPTASPSPSYSEPPTPPPIGGPPGGGNITCNDDSDCPPTYSPRFCDDSTNMTRSCQSIAHYICDQNGTVNSSCVLSGVGLLCSNCPGGCQDGDCVVENETLCMDGNCSPSEGFTIYTRPMIPRIIYYDYRGRSYTVQISSIIPLTSTLILDVNGVVHDDHPLRQGVADIIDGLPIYAASIDYDQRVSQATLYVGGDARTCPEDCPTCGDGLCNGGEIMVDIPERSTVVQNYNGAPVTIVDIYYDQVTLNVNGVYATLDKEESAVINGLPIYVIDTDYDPTYIDIANASLLFGENILSCSGDCL